MHLKRKRNRYRLEGKGDRVMAKIQSSWHTDPESYDIWEAGHREYIKKERARILQPCRNLPLLAFQMMDITRTDKRWYQHVNYKFMALEMILSGRAEYRLERETLIAEPGMLYVVAKGSNVRMVNAGKQQRRKLTLLIHGCCLDTIAESLGFGKDRLLKLSQPEKVERMMREIGRNIADSANPEYISGKTYELLLHLSSELSNEPEDLRPALDWIANNPSGKISIPELAEQCGLSGSTLRRRFIAVFGLPPAKYLLKRRMILGRELLLNGISIKETAARCGFSSPLLFAQSYKNHYGVPPSCTKKMLKKDVL